MSKLFSKSSYLAMISVLLLVLSVGISLINYNESVGEAYRQLEESSLPLSVDNIYTEIQKNIIRPNYISSMMANDAFLKRWIVDEERDKDVIEDYLGTITKRYGVYRSFLVVDDSLNYYSDDGFLETIKETREHDWYFNFRASPYHSETNIDTNDLLGGSILIFLNYKIFDDSNQYIGTTGVSIKTRSIELMLDNFLKKYLFNVYFISADGEMVFNNQNTNNSWSLMNDAGKTEFIDKVTAAPSSFFRIKTNGEGFVYNSKFIKEMNMYLVVEARVSDFTQAVTQTFLSNLLISLFLTMAVLAIIVAIIRRYNKRLEFQASHDSLTSLPNRRAVSQFDERRRERKDVDVCCIVAFDIDHFKSVNDLYGHMEGDRVLQTVAQVCKQQLRKTDLVARWGGEEFVVLLSNTDIEFASQLAEKLRLAIAACQFENDDLECGYFTISASFGVVQLLPNETLYEGISRADDLLYDAKQNGRNQVVNKPLQAVG